MSTQLSSSARLLASLFGGLLLLQGCSSLPAPVVRPDTAGRPDTAVAGTGGTPRVQIEQLKSLYDQGESLIDSGGQKDQVRQMARSCIELATRAEAEQPGRAFAPYYRALCQSLAVRVVKGVWGRTFEAKGLAAQIEKDALEAIRRDESLEQGGPLRLLGLFYLRAPRWPMGPGDVDKGTQILARARERFPQEPLNRLFYAEALLAHSDLSHARRELQGVDSAKLPPRYNKVHVRLQGELRG